MVEFAKCTAAAAVLDELIPGEGIVFGIPGGAVSPVFDAILDRPSLRLVIPKHEAQGAFMAGGYARATGRPGIVLTTAGPGFTNCLTGLASAYADGLPIIVVSGEVPRAAFGRGAIQEGSAHGMDVLSIARRVTKFAAQILVSGTATTTARRAYSTVLNGRQGPAFISLPLDVGIAKTRRVPIYGMVSSRFEIDTQGCKHAVSLLAHAKRPLVLVGSGARPGYGKRAIRALAEKLQLPIMVTTKAKGVFPEDHPLYMGVFGLGGHESIVNYLQAESADVLMVCGSSLNDFATNAWSPLLAPSQALIHVDIEALQIGKNYQTDLGLVGTVDSVLGRMLEVIDSRPVRSSIPCLRDIPIRPSKGERGKVSAQQIMVALNEACPADTVYSCDVGEFLTPAINMLRVRGEGDFLLGLGFGSMGASIGNAIGYKLGAPCKNVVAICGDGSFLMYGNDLATAVRYGAAITVCVMNDGRLNMCHQGHLNVYGRTPNLAHEIIDVTEMARAMGADSLIVENVEQLTRVMCTTPRKVRVIDIRIDPDIVMKGSERNAALRHFMDEDV